MLSNKIRSLANSAGIDVLGFAKASPFSDYPLTDSQRTDPKLTLPDAKTIIVAGIYIGGVTLPFWKNPWYGRTSRLYLSEFFLDVVKPLEPIADLLISKGFQSVICDGSADEGSILPLKLAAIRAGLGWQGKNSLLVSKTYGTFLALGGIITDAVLEYNTEKETDKCGKCNECRKKCPSKALARPYILNKDQCLSNLLQVDHLPEDVQKVMDNRVGDCEICQEACPWNRKHLKNPLVTNMTKKIQREINEWKHFFYLPHLAQISEKEYIENLGHLNTDIPYKFFHRNVLIALENAEKSIQVRLEINPEEDLETDEVIALYKANKWSSAEKPELLISALRNSNAIVTARISGKLVGIGNALSDGYLVVYYPHMLVHPEHQGKGIGRAMMTCMQQKYASFHQQILVSDANAIEFYKSLGFKRAGKTEPMWIYRGNDH